MLWLALRSYVLSFRLMMLKLEAVVEEVVDFQEEAVVRMEVIEVAVACIVVRGVVVLIDSVVGAIDHFIHPATIEEASIITEMAIL